MFLDFLGYEVFRLWGSDSGWRSPPVYRGREPPRRWGGANASEKWGVPMRSLISTLSPLRGPDWFRFAHLPPSRKAKYKQVYPLLLPRASVLPINRERAPSGLFAHAVRAFRKVVVLCTLSPVSNYITIERLFCDRFFREILCYFTSEGVSWWFRGVVGAMVEIWKTIRHLIQIKSDLILTKSDLVFTKWDIVLRHTIFIVHRWVKKGNGGVRGLPLPRFVDAYAFILRPRFP